MSSIADSSGGHAPGLSVQNYTNLPDTLLSPIPLAVCTRTLDGRLQGRGYYLCRAIDSTGATIDFVPSRLRDAATAQRLFRKALTDPSHP